MLVLQSREVCALERSLELGAQVHAALGEDVHEEDLEDDDVECQADALVDGAVAVEAGVQVAELDAHRRALVAVVVLGWLGGGGGGAAAAFASCGGFKELDDPADFDTEMAEVRVYKGFDSGITLKRGAIDWSGRWG